MHQMASYSLSTLCLPLMTKCAQVDTDTDTDTGLVRTFRSRQKEAEARYFDCDPSRIDCSRSEAEHHRYTSRQSSYRSEWFRIEQSFRICFSKGCGKYFVGSETRWQEESHVA